MNSGGTWSLLGLVLCLSCTACDRADQAPTAPPQVGAASERTATTARQLSLSIKNERVTLDARNIPHNELLTALAAAGGAVVQGNDEQVGLVTLALTDVPIDDALDRVSLPLSHAVTRRPDGRWQLAISNTPAEIVGANNLAAEQPTPLRALPHVQGPQPRRVVQEVYSTDPATGKPTFSMQEVDQPANPTTQPTINAQQSRTGLQGDDTYERGQYVAHSRNAESPTANPPVMPR